MGLHEFRGEQQVRGLPSNRGVGLSIVQSWQAGDVTAPLLSPNPLGAKMKGLEK